MKIKVKKYVYNVILDCASRGEQFDPEVWSYDNRKNAEKKLEEFYKEGLSDDYCYDKDESSMPDYIDLYMDGWYQQDHFHAHIERQEVE